MKSQVKLSSLRSHNPSAFPGISDDAIVVRKQMSSQVAIQPDEEMTCIVKISTIETDRDNEVIIPKGIRHEQFDKNPVCLWSHQHGAPPVGSVIALEATEKALFAKIKMAKTPLGLELWTLIKEGHLRACSIGFIGLSAVVPGDIAFESTCDMYGIPKSVSRIFTSVELIENSWASIPSNSAALLQAVSAKTITLDPVLFKQLHLDEKEVAVAQNEAAVAPAVATEATPGAIANVTVTINPDGTTTQVGPVTYTEASAPTKVEPVKTEPVVVAPVVTTPVEAKPEPKVEPLWRVIREGDLVLDEAGKAMAKALAEGKVV